MKYRKQPIAWSVWCGAICLLVIVLWLRGGWWEIFYFRGSEDELAIAYAFLLLFGLAPLPLSHGSTDGRGNSVSEPC
jgi:hypothetical protein